MKTFKQFIEERRKDVSSKEMNKYQKGIYDKYKQITNPVKKA